MSIETIQIELTRRTQERISNTTNSGMVTFRNLINEIDCMSDDELLSFENKLIDYGFKAVTDRRAEFATTLANSIPRFMSNNRNN